MLSSVVPTSDVVNEFTGTNEANVAASVPAKAASMDGVLMSGLGVQLAKEGDGALAAIEISRGETLRARLGRPPNTLLLKEASLKSCGNDLTNHGVGRY